MAAKSNIRYFEGPAGAANVSSKWYFVRKELLYWSSCFLVSFRSDTRLAASTSSTGYSQLTSRPSSPRFLTRSTAEEANKVRPCSDEAGPAKFWEYVAPPIERRTFKFPLFLIEYNCPRHPYSWAPVWTAVCSPHSWEVSASRSERKLEWY